MNLWSLLLVVFGAGAMGGIVNALMTDNGFILPKPEKTGSGTIIRPGFVGNIILSGVAACVSWGLYGPLGTAYIVGEDAAAAGNASPSRGITLAAFVGAILVGVAGARWLTNEVDKSLLRAAASRAAASTPSEALATRLALASPVQALRFAQEAHPSPKG